MKTASFSKIRLLSVCTLLAWAFFSAPAWAGAPADIGADIGIVERPGRSVPLDIVFYDETGKKVSLRELLGRPAVISLGYYGCSNLCRDISANIAEVLGKMKSEPARDFSVITISIDEKDTPRDALDRKENYFRTIARPFPKEGWRFLTGGEKSIRAFTESVGFKSKRQGKGFEHPAALVVISGSGRIIRYIYGDSYLPYDIEMALAEASAGRSGPAIPKALLLCYRYGAKNGKFALDTLRLAGTLALFFAAAFFIYLNTSGRKKD